MRVAVAIELTEVERAKLDSYARGRSTPARLVLRAKIVPKAAAGLQNSKRPVHPPRQLRRVKSSSGHTQISAWRARQTTVAA